MITISEFLISITRYVKILKVTEKEIHIQTRRCLLQITGDELWITYLNNSEIILQGKIVKVDFISYEERI